MKTTNEIKVFSDQYGNRMDTDDLRRMIYLFDNLKRITKIINAIRHIVANDVNIQIMKDLHELEKYFERELSKTGVEV